MKTYLNLWYLAEVFLEWGMFRTKYVEKINPLFMSKTFFQKSCRLWDTVVAHDINRQATDESIIYNAEQNRRNLHSEDKEKYRGTYLLIYSTV